jgi:hypothetical protein
MTKLVLSIDCDSAFCTVEDAIHALCMVVIALTKKNYDGFDRSMGVLHNYTRRKTSHQSSGGFCQFKCFWDSGIKIAVKVAIV